MTSPCWRSWRRGSSPDRSRPKFRALHGGFETGGFRENSACERRAIVATLWIVELIRISLDFPPEFSVEFVFDATVKLNAGRPSDYIFPLPVVFHDP